MGYAHIEASRLAVLPAGARGQRGPDGAGLRIEAVYANEEAPAGAVLVVPAIRMWSGIDNFDSCPPRLYRGAQPAPLERPAGLTTVVRFNNSNSSTEWAVPADSPLWPLLDGLVEAGGGGGWARYTTPAQRKWERARMRVPGMIHDLAWRLSHGRDCARTWRSRGEQREAAPIPAARAARALARLRAAVEGFGE